MNDSPFDMEEIIAPFLREGARDIAAAVSGGPDSMALCYVLAHCSKEPVHVLTVDHGLRPEAAQEAAQVADWVEGLPNTRHTVLKREMKNIVTSRTALEDSPSLREGVGGGGRMLNSNTVNPHLNPPPQGEENNASGGVRGGTTRIQEDARRDRYALMAAYCAENNIGQLFVAHHQDDQAETFLFRLAKGSGLDGLGAMRPVYDYNDDLSIIRPFLDISKSELVSFCTAQDIPYIKDPSNEDTRFARVRLRGSYEVLEEEGLTPKRLAVTAGRLARAREALDFYTTSVWEEALSTAEPSRIVFNFERMKNEPAEIRLRVLVKAMEMINQKQGYGPRMEKLESLSGRVFDDSDFKKASLGGCLVGLDQKMGLITVEKEKKSAS